MADLDDLVGIVLNGRKLIVNKNGEIYGLTSAGEMRLIKNVAAGLKLGYNHIQCGKKLIYRHRIIAYTYLNLDLNNSKLQVDHIDGNKLNNSLTNLRVVPNQQNQWNQTKALGFSKSKNGKKWISTIKLNGKTIYLGTFPTESQARNAYIAAKLIYHRII